MEIVPPVFSVVLGLVLRLIIPVVITLALVYFLRRLDARWQAEAEQLLLLPVVEKPKCWETCGCSVDERINCPGYQTNQPCWQAFRNEDGHLKERCLDCNVFRHAPAPVNP